MSFLGPTRCPWAGTVGLPDGNVSHSITSILKYIADPIEDIWELSHSPHKPLVF